MKILTILGARPQFIKSASISEKIKLQNNLSEIVIHTGQHFDQNMSDIFFKDMGLSKPNYNLEVNRMNHGAMTSKMIEKLEPIIIKEDPDGVLVYGDTNSTLAGSLTAAKLNKPIFHVEAGLRSYNRSMPEEINRLITDHLSTILFCPTETAKNNLLKEGITKNVIVSGDVMYDSFLKFNKHLIDGINNHINIYPNYILATIHRPENTDYKDKLISIFNNLDRINSKSKIIMPLHPRTIKKVQEYGITTNIEILQPIGYLSMIDLTLEKFSSDHSNVSELLLDTVLIIPG